MKKLKYFTLGEAILYFTSLTLIIASYLAFGASSPLTLAASLVGVTSLVFTAKGNPIGQLLMVIFSVMYGIISYGFSYYGEMLTYLAMTAPMALFSLIAWLKNPYKGRRSEVAVGTVSRRESIFAIFICAAVTVIFYFILKALGTANIIPSTLSVVTSFLAVYLTARRSSVYALGYAANDIVLIVLWIMASLTDKSYISVTICFTVFLVWDVYGFVCWERMKRRQSEN